MGSTVSDSTPEECAKACDDQAGCNSFTLVGWGPSTCYLKDKCVKATDPADTGTRTDMVTYYSTTC